MFLKLVASIVFIGFAIPFEASQSEVPADYAFRIQADEAYERGDFSHIVAIATKYIDRFPDDLEGYRRRAWAHICLGNFEAAIDDANVGINASDLESLYNRGVAYARLGNYKQAIRDLTAAIERHPRETEFARYSTPLDEIDFDLDSDTDFTLFDTPSPSPHLAKSYQERAMVRALAGQEEASMEDLFQAGMRAETDDPVHFANWLRDLGHYERAVLEYAGIIALYPRSEEQYVERAFAYWYGGDLPAAAADFTRADKILTDEVEGWQTVNPRIFESCRWQRDIVLTQRGLLYWSMGHREQALADLESAIADVDRGFVELKDIESETPHIRFLYAFLLHEADRLEDAARFFHDAQQALPEILTIREDRLEQHKEGTRELFKKAIAVAMQYIGGELSAQPGGTDTSTPMLFGESAAEGVVPRTETLLQIHDLSVTKSVVAPESAFSVNVSYTARDARKEATELPVTLSLSIKEGERELLSVPSKTVMAPNGAAATTIQHLTASKRRGTYTIAVSLALGTKTDTRAVNVEVR
jgi:tetratricopeptide (TPR) repeat protein